MFNAEINILLEEIYELPFLLKVEKISESERDYRKSDFYKTHKIPLATLYEKFEMHQSLNRDIKNDLEIWLDRILSKLTDTIYNIDTDLLADKIEEFMDSLGNNERIVEFIVELLEKFDIKKIEELANRFEQEAKKFK